MIISSGLDEDVFIKKNKNNLGATLVELSLSFSVLLILIFILSTFVVNYYNLSKGDVALVNAIRNSVLLYRVSNQTAQLELANEIKKSLLEEGVKVSNSEILICRGVESSATCCNLNELALTTKTPNFCNKRNDSWIGEFITIKIQTPNLPSKLNMVVYLR